MVSGSILNILDWDSITFLKVTCSSVGGRILIEPIFDGLDALLTGAWISSLIGTLGESMFDVKGVPIGIVLDATLVIGISGVGVDDMTLLLEVSYKEKL